MRVELKGNYLIRFFGILFLLFSSILTPLTLAAQDEPNLVLETNPVTCTGNGTISASLEVESDPTDLIYRLFRLGEDSPLVENESGVFSDLPVGTYLVAAVFTLNENPLEVSAEIELVSNFQPLSYTVSAQNLCENALGSIEVVVNQGNPETFELRGDVERPPQASPVFDAIPAGKYTVVVTDECGDRLSQSFEVQKAEFILEEEFQQFQAELSSCGEIAVGHLVRSVGAEIAYPLQARFTVFAPDGSTQEITTELSEGGATESVIYGNLPFYTGEAYSYDLEVTDNCGQTAVLENNLIDRTLTISEDLFWGAGLCGKRRLSIKPTNFVAPYTVSFTEYPGDFDPELFNEGYPGPFTEENLFFGSEEMPIPFGTYSFSITDACGSTASISREFKDLLSGPVPTVYKGCGPTTGSLQLNSFDYEFTLIEMTAGPASFAGQLPLDLSENISQNDPRRFFMSNLPAGDYEFTSYTTCNTEHVTEITIEGAEILTNDLNIEENCGSFNLSLNHQDNLDENQTTRFGIQKRNTDTGEWGHPETGMSYVEGEELNAENSILIVNGATTINLSYYGELRLVKSIRVWKNGQDIIPNEPSYNFCLETLEEFEVKERSSFTSINTFQCVEGSYELSVDASGYPPITYKIVEKDGLPFEINNGSDPLFQNLEAGRYRVQLEDACGNLTNTTVQISGENLPKIIPENLCEGDNGSLSIKNLDFLSFEWFNKANPDEVLSTEPSLEFTPFNLATHEGVYGVRLSNDTPGSCLNETLEFTIDEASLNPEPGIGQEVIVCKGEIVDLFDFLEGPYNNYGTWEELSNSGALVGNVWSSANLTTGTYTFEYTITGICSGERSTQVTINLSAVPPAPQGEGLQEFCAPGNFTVADLVATGENIQWYLTPEGTNPLSSETSLESGRTYYAEQQADGCPSDQRLPVEVVLYPEVTGFEIQENQTVYQMEVPQILIGETASGGSGDFSYQWEIQSGDAEWVLITGATNKDFPAPPLMETTRFRRITEDPVCGSYTSNEAILTVEVAPIVANGEQFGPFKNFEEHRLPSIFANDSLKLEPVTGEDVSLSILSITDEAGEEQNLVYSLDENGSFFLPEDTPPNSYLLQYRICQSEVPTNCAEAQIRITVIGISMDLEKSIDRTQAVQGELVDYTLSLTNTSLFPLEEVQVTDLLPEGLMLLSTSPQASEGGIWVIPEIQPDETILLELSVLAASEGSFTNEARVEVENFDETVASEELQVRPVMVDLSIQKTSGTEPVRDGDEFEYLLTITNDGMDEAARVRIVDFLPPNLQYLQASVQNTGLPAAPQFRQEGQQLIWELDRFPVGAELEIRLTVSAREDGRISNRAEVSSEGVDTQPENNTALEQKSILPLFIPNVIKPDFDGKNDTFVIRADHKFDQVEVLIFNRWGDLVFGAEDYQNDWAAEGLLSGTYYYQVRGMDAQGNEKEYQGWIQVIKE
ncbi:gliding motility-associated C-terminal domain-containing protein [Cyclobacterium jeungdonense]|uniref:Gliding motility-associated C-terminal domain-containing protein n=1 Tax=Cyclobacterium jeungdonense TaxID=708087 RepID=A0ABT8C9M6_9BACT|nr:gliding motility-associated C-terminal domain-containing protein [Cyclobacterium jeungdonense]MDN3688333.1 gliding motility-associated C-terminal domain-containing protein [Cyclobacterium jeungdonense]